MTQPCPGGCNAAWRASGEGQPRPGDPVWCGHDTTRIRRQLADLDYQAAVRAFHADGHHEQNRQPAHGTGCQSPSQAADDVEEITGWLWDWEDVIRKEVFHLPASFHAGTLPEIRSKVIAWLAERLDPILACDLIAADFGREVGERHWELLGKNGDRPPRTGLVNCPRCDHKLAWLDGRDGLQCGGCGRTMDAAEYDDRVRARREMEHTG